MKQLSNFVGYVAAFAALVATVFKFQHWPGAGMLLTLTGILLALYFPLFLIDRCSEAAQGRILGWHVVGALCLGLLQLGITFKINHWPGASMLILAGVGCAVLFAIALYMARSKEEGHTLLMNGSATLAIIFFAVGLLLKIMHQPGSGELLIASPLLLFVVYFPLYLMNKSIPEEKKHTYLRQAFSTIVLAAVLALLLDRFIMVKSDDTMKVVTGEVNPVPPAPSE
jgi:hypothetical protein